MTTRYDILDARYDEENHSCKADKCPYPCPVLPELRAKRYKIAERWGLDIGDDERQRRQYNERTQTGAST